MSSLGCFGALFLIITPCRAVVRLADSARWAKPFCFYECRLVAKLHERGGDCFDEGRWTTHEYSRRLARRPRGRGQHFAIYTPAQASPIFRSLAGPGMNHFERRSPRHEARQFVPVN